MDSNILAVGISAIVSLVIAVWTSIYTTRKNIELEKEMYFRKEKIENLKNVSEKYKSLMIFYSNQYNIILSMHLPCVESRELNYYKEELEKYQKFNDADFTSGNINIPFNKHEEILLYSLNIKNLNENLNDCYCATNIKLKELYTEWDLEEFKSSKNLDLLNDAYNFLIRLTKMLLKINIILEGIYEYNLSMMTNRKAHDSKDMVNNIIIKTEKLIKKYSLKEL